jgi:hypothetical protein
MSVVDIDRAKFQDSLYELLAKHWPDVNSPTSDPDIVWPGEVLRQAIVDATNGWIVSEVRRDVGAWPFPTKFRIDTNWLEE